MGVLNFIKKIILTGPKATPAPTSDYVYIHEDDAGQIELLPYENFDYLKGEAEKIATFSHQHSDNFGWTECYIRQEPPVKLIQRYISEDSFKKHFLDQGYQNRELRFSGMKSVPISEFAFLKDSFLFYYSSKEQLIDSIYFSQYDHNHQIFIDTILFLSRTYDLVLADWWKLLIFDTRQEREIQRYLTVE